MLHTRRTVLLPYPYFRRASQASLAGNPRQGCKHQQHWMTFSAESNTAPFQHGPENQAEIIVPIGAERTLSVMPWQQKRSAVTYVTWPSLLTAPVNFDICGTHESQSSVGITTDLLCSLVIRGTVYAQPPYYSAQSIQCHGTDCRIAICDFSLLTVPGLCVIRDEPTVLSLLNGLA